MPKPYSNPNPRKKAMKSRSRNPREKLDRVSSKKNMAMKMRAISIQ